MTQVIWKFPLRITGTQTIDMPEGAVIRHVAAQGSYCYLWAQVDPSAGIQDKTIAIFGTGHPMPDNPGEFIGTFMMEDVFVWHVYEVQENTK